jgi:hypothetical protein
VLPRRLLPTKKTDILSPLFWRQLVYFHVILRPTMPLNFTCSTTSTTRNLLISSHGEPSSLSIRLDDNGDDSHYNRTTGLRMTSMWFSIISTTKSHFDLQKRTSTISIVRILVLKRTSTISIVRILVFRVPNSGYPSQFPIQDILPNSSFHINFHKELRYRLSTMG